MKYSDFFWVGALTPGASESVLYFIQFIFWSQKGSFSGRQKQKRWNKSHRKKQQKRNTWAPAVHLLTFQNHSAVPFLSTAANSAAFPLWLLPSGVMSIGQRRDQIIAINAALSSDTGRITLRWELVCLRALRRVQWEDTREKMSATGQILIFFISVELSSKSKRLCDSHNNETSQRTSALGLVDPSAHTRIWLTFSARITL